ncbi:MAG: MaoC family dehydratase [Alphaproteobacteria bacterium]|nr:MaoC family dehydratase [Alphaproteobacteria bacterium]
MTPDVAPTVIDSIKALESLVGETLGVSGWIPITQERVDRFAEATDDRQWIHVDVDRAKRESPFGEPVAHGYLTLSLLPRMVIETMTFTPKKTGINYGLDRVRFISPVPVGARIRGHVVLRSVERRDAETLHVGLSVTVEIEGVEKPACFADSIVRYLV